MHKKCLASGVRPDPLEKHSTSPESLTAVVGQGMEHSPSWNYGRCVAGTDAGREEQIMVVGEEWEG